jgi:hypothetical protein
MRLIVRSCNISSMTHTHACTQTTKTMFEVTWVTHHQLTLLCDTALNSAEQHTHWHIC